MITFEDGVNGRINVFLKVGHTSVAVGYIFFNDNYYFISDRGSIFSAEMLQAISKKLEELNGGDL